MECYIVPLPATDLLLASPARQLSTMRCWSRSAVAVAPFLLFLLIGSARPGQTTTASPQFGALYSVEVCYVPTDEPGAAPLQVRGG